MPKVMTTETLRGVTDDIASGKPVSFIAERNGVGRQWIYDWKNKLEYHGLDDCHDLSDEVLRGIYDGHISTPRLTSNYPGWHFKLTRRKQRMDRD